MKCTALWKKMMNITLKKTSLILFLSAASMSTSIAFGQTQFQNGEYIRVAHSERDSGDKDKEVQQERSRSRERSNSNARSTAERDDARKGGLSVDERRALRQQIDEAGREIYKPRR